MTVINSKAYQSSYFLPYPSFYLLVPVYKLVHMCCFTIKVLHILEFSLSHEFLPLEVIAIIVLINVGFIKRGQFQWLCLGDRSRLDILSPVQFGPHAAHLSLPPTTLKHATFIYPG